MKTDGRVLRNTSTTRPTLWNPIYDHRYDLPIRRDSDESIFSINCFAKNRSMWSWTGFYELGRVMDRFLWTGPRVLRTGPWRNSSGNRCIGLRDLWRVWNHNLLTVLWSKTSFYRIGCVLDVFLRTGPCVFSNWSIEKLVKKHIHQSFSNTSSGLVMI